MGVINSRWLRRFLCKEPSLRVAALWIKAWSKAAGINDGRQGWLTSYAFLILFVYYAVATGRTRYYDPRKHQVECDSASTCPRFLGPIGAGATNDVVGNVIAGFFDF